MRTFFRPISTTIVSTLLLLTVISCAAVSGGFRSLSVQEAQTFLTNNPETIVLDVRTPEEFASATGHLKNAKLLPVQELEQRLAELQPHKSKPILVYCRTGGRSARASEILSKQGFTAINITGGILDWNAANFPVEK